MAPSAGSADTDEGAAEREKERGNELVRERKHAEACDRYSAALDLLVGSGSESSPLRAPCLSNRSQCHFELGRYSDSLKDARSCLDCLRGIDGASLSEEKSRLLRGKNLYRIARAAFYGGAQPSSSEWERDILAPLREVASCGNVASQKLAKKMLGQMEYYERVASVECGAGTTSPLQLPPVHRSNLNNPVKEYYTYGHDTPTSALEGIQFSLLPESERGSLGILFGGVGDLRHVFATLLDGHSQVRSLSQDERDSVRIRLVLNDINLPVLARGLLFLVVLKRVGDSKWSPMQENEGAQNQLTLLVYLFFGYVMPPAVYADLISIIQELRRFEDCTTFEREYPWISVKSQDWAKIRTMLGSWEHLQAGVDSIPSLTAALDNIFDPSPENVSSSISDMYYADPEDRKRVEKTVLGGANEEKTALYEEAMSLDSLDHWTPEQVEEFRSELAPGSTDSELVEAIKIMFRSRFEEMDVGDFIASQKDTTPEGRYLDDAFIKETHAILPPMSSNSREYGRVFDEIRGGEKDPKGIIDIDLAANCGEKVRTEWFLNPTFFDPEWVGFNGGETDKQRFNPVTEIGEFLEDLMEFMEYPLGGDEEMLKADFFHSAWTFFGNVALSLGQMTNSGQVQLTLSIDSVTAYCRSIQGEQADPKLMFQRILVSNVPDYIGMLSIFTEVMPLLQKPTPELNTFLQGSVLANTGLWEDYAQYIYSSTGIRTLENVSSLLGFQSLSENSTFIEFNRWTWSSEGVSASREEVKEWLNRLFLLIALPPERHPMENNVEHCASNIALFLRTCCFCVEILQYPSHWINTVIDELVSVATYPSKAMKTTVNISSAKSPSRFLEKKEEVKLTSFALELKLQVSVWQRQKAIVRPLCTKSLPSGKLSRYILGVTNFTVLGDPERCRFVGGRTYPNVLGFILTAERPEVFDDLKEDLKHMPAFFVHDRTSIRNNIIKTGSKFGHVFSCAGMQSCWRDQKHSMTFWMPDEVFERYQTHYLSLIRTDSWALVGGKPMQLCQAVKLGLLVT